MCILEYIFHASCFESWDTLGDNDHNSDLLGGLVPYHARTMASENCTPSSSRLFGFVWTKDGVETSGLTLIQCVVHKSNLILVVCMYEDTPFFGPCICCVVFHGEIFEEVLMYVFVLYTKFVPQHLGMTDKVAAVCIGFDLQW